MLTFANALVALLGLYALFGLLFALYFAFKGVNKIDPVAQEGTLGFRLLILPGAVALWPLLALRLFRGVNEPPPEENLHRRAALEGRAAQGRRS